MGILLRRRAETSKLINYDSTEEKETGTERQKGLVSHRNAHINGKTSIPTPKAGHTVSSVQHTSTVQHAAVYVKKHIPYTEVDVGAWQCRSPLWVDAHTLPVAPLHHPCPAAVETIQIHHSKNHGCS